MKHTTCRSRLVPLQVAMALALLTGPALAAGPAPEARAKARLEALWQSSHVPGISAAVASRGRIVFSSGVGFADLDNIRFCTDRASIPPTPRTRPISFRG